MLNDKFQILSKESRPTGPGFEKQKTGLEFRNWGPARRVGSPSEARTILVPPSADYLFDICDL
jgi:hypothetical protein